MHAFGIGFHRNWPVHKKKILRQRVLGRWKKDRRHAIRSTFKAWKQRVKFVKEETAIRRNKTMLRKAEALRIKLMKRKYFHAMFQHIEVAKVEKKNMKQAMLLMDQELALKAYNKMVWEAEKATEQRKYMAGLFMLIAGASDELFPRCFSCIISRVLVLDVMSINEFRMRCWDSLLV